MPDVDKVVDQLIEAVFQHAVISDESTRFKDITINTHTWEAAMFELARVIKFFRSRIVGKPMVYCAHVFGCRLNAHRKRTWRDVKRGA